MDHRGRRKNPFFAPPPQRSENVKKVLDRGQKFRLFSPLQCVRGKKEGGKRGRGFEKKKKKEKKDRFMSLGVAKKGGDFDERREERFVTHFAFPLFSLLSRGNA